MINKDDAEWMAIAVTWIAGLFAFARKTGNTERRIEVLESDVSKIKKEFKTADGEPRLMSFAQHQIIQNACQKRMDERQDNINRRMEQHDEKLDKILEALSSLKSRN